MRELEPDEIARLRKAGEFFWADLALEGGPDPDEVAAAFGLSDRRLRTLYDFDQGGSPVPPAARRGEAGGVRVLVFGRSRAGRPLRRRREPRPVPRQRLPARRLPAHRARAAFDLPAAVAPDGIPAGRSERYAVYVALEGMTATLLEALNAVEREIAEIESSLMDEDARAPTTTPGA